MNKKTQGILLIIPLDIVIISTLVYVMYLMIVDEPFIMLGIFVLISIILMFVKGIKLVNDNGN